MTPKQAIPYGRRSIPLDLETAASVTWIHPNDVAGADDPKQAIRAALASPLAGYEIPPYGAARSVAIAINDKTRPVPHDLMLPPLLARLAALGYPREAVTLIIATGTHIPMPPETHGEVVPPGILDRYAVESHDCDAETLIDLGTTERGTPIRVNRRFAEADLRIVVGNVEPHHFAGFSGGVKTAAIGLAGRETATANHALLRHPAAALAHFADNPLRQDIEEIGRRMAIDAALNVVMNRHKAIVKAWFGPPRAVIEAAMPEVRRIYEVPVAQPFDVMITSPGGYPKDINLYQAHKAVSCANRVTREGGTVILVAACEEGVGSEGYAAWMARGFPSHEAVMAQFVQEPFRIGPHKAYIFARDAVTLDAIWVVSEIDPAQVRQLLLTPGTLQEALDAVVAPLPASARIGVLPYANATIPNLEPGP
jgi:nickel-dependent lactate racemase